MSYKIRTRDEHLFEPGPKRILAIDGGGLRGIFSLAILKKMEDMFKSKYGDRFRMAHYFDLMAGTSTGSVISASLALGMTVDEVTAQYEKLGHEVFKRSWFRHGLARPKYSKKKLAAELLKTFGVEAATGDPVKLRSAELLTGLLVMTKRRDTGSPWPLANNPQGKYFETNLSSSYIANGDFPLWRVVRASTAAPAFFKGETLTIAEEKGKKPVIGQFVDGGVSPFNNPALQALMYAGLSGYKLNWKLGADNLLIVSIGTGAQEPGATNKLFEAQNAVKSLVSLMDDCNTLVQIMLQWMSHSATSRMIDREIGDLQADALGGRPLTSYLRYNIELSGEAISKELGLNLDARTLKKLAKMDQPANMPLLKVIGTAVAGKYLKEQDFPANFDLS